jgi:thiamine biosynthesis lipoprotein
MGTEMTLRVAGPDRRSAVAASETVLDAVTRVEDRLSTWSSSSELSAVNRSIPGEATAISSELARDLESALECACATGGAFSPGLGSLIEAWGLRIGGRNPTDNELDSALRGASLDHVRLEAGRVTRLHPRFMFEEGAFGKGAGIDEAFDGLDSTDATSAVIDLGGQIAVWGTTTATVEIAHPRHRHRPVLRFELTHGSVATSGSSERGIVVDGVRLGHILNPHTGRPGGDFGSVTVWTDSGFLADCLSTALYVMGSQAALAWSSTRPDVDILVLTVEADHLEAVASPDLYDKLTVEGDGIELTRFEADSLSGTSPSTRPGSERGD